MRREFIFENICLMKGITVIIFWRYINKKFIEYGVWIDKKINHVTWLLLTIH